MCRSTDVLTCPPVCCGPAVYGLVKAGHQVELAQKVEWSRWAKQAADYDLILADYGSMKGAMAHVTSLRCKLRILDTFGTSPQYNDPRQKLQAATPPLGEHGQRNTALRALTFQASRPCSLRADMGDCRRLYLAGLRMDQYFSYYPDVAEGSTFIGFSVTPPDSAESAVAEKVAPAKKWQAVLWGKHPSYMALPKYGPWLSKLCKLIPIVATVEKNKIEPQHSFPSCVNNRGLLSVNEYHTLVEESSVVRHPKRPRSSH